MHAKTWTTFVVASTILHVYPASTQVQAVMSTHDYVGTAYLLLPLLGGGIFHGLCVKYDWLPWMKAPLDGGREFRGRRLFGANKTFRGVFALAAGSALFMGVQASVLHRYPLFRGLELIDYGTLNGWLAGFVIGGFAMLAELPNSFLKRQSGIAPGTTARGPAAVLFYVLDQVDILVGVWLAMALFVPVRMGWVVFSVLLVAVAHQLLTWITYALGMRTSSR